MHRGQDWNDSQLQQRQVRIAIVGLIGALLGDVFLEDGSRLRVVPIKPIEDLVNVFRSVRRVIECDAHGDGRIWEECGGSGDGGGGGGGAEGDVEIHVAEKWREEPRGDPLLGQISAHRCLHVNITLDD